MFRGVPVGAQARNENTILRVQYMQQAMVFMMFSLMCAMVARYVKSIEIHKKESVDEKVFVETMFQLYSLFWMLATAFNFLLAADPHLESPCCQQICDFIIGALCGIFCVTLIEYMRGFLLVDS